MSDEEKESHPTPKLDELEKGPWPSFVRDMKQVAGERPMVKDLLGQLEVSYQEKRGHWKHGGVVGVRGYGGGVIGRYSDLPEQFPHVAHFHTVRINQPSGWFYTTEALRQLCDIWDRHGSGLTNMHGSTGDIIFLGTKSQELEPCFSELTEAGWDLGGSGSAIRTPSCCVGPARCEFACYDTLAFTYDLTQQYQDEMHRPALPYKFKLKMSGCPNDCVSAIARADLSVIGIWRDAIRVDQDAVREYAGAGLDLWADVCGRCPTRCMRWDGKALQINDSECNKCMHCINVMPKALRPGVDTGACILIGGKSPIIHGAQLSSVLVPFMKIEPPYAEFKELLEKIYEVWGENGMNRERVGEFIQRVGLGSFLEEIGIEPVPQMVNHPRTNPYIFYEEYFVETGESGEETE
ncbi:MAG: dissimilatory-type sulfite reductase subunit alpha [Candidatus Tectomicrobia bacterium]|uniref:Dissimilatory-type sulfite reductase subunit alpha n=1 Tax=Tectimicrobiota bacterium TaxID=2528274 RepID=A0A932FZS3_UNCTE|nr:dissimilatory-type sulfite reductase subunit alpha [Candidatus Tectomicrobia bacterium]